MIAIGYTRVSTEEQANSGLGLAAQEAKIRAYCDAMGWTLLRIESDPGLSGKNMDRPGLQAALRTIETGEAQALVVLKLDRLTRSVRDLGTLMDLFDGNDRALVGVQDSINTSTAAGRLVLNVLGSVAQWEREAIGERTTAALAVKRERGEKTGGHVPFGYDHVDGKLVENAYEQAVIAKAREVRALGKSLGYIADVLNDMGTKTKLGGQWTAKQVSRLV